MRIISIDDLYENINGLGTDEIVLDVRTAEEFAEGHIKGARNIPHDKVSSIADELKPLRTVYVHCKMGGRAQKASECLRNAFQMCF